MWTTPNYQVVFRRVLPRLGYQSAIWAVAHRLCRTVRKILHEGVRFIKQSVEPDPKAKKKRAQMLARALRKLGYEPCYGLVFGEVTPPVPVTALISKTDPL